MRTNRRIIRVLTAGTSSVACRSGLNQRSGLIEASYDMSVTFPDIDAARAVRPQLKAAMQKRGISVKDYGGDDLQGTHDGERIVAGYTSPEVVPARVTISGYTPYSKP